MNPTPLPRDFFRPFADLVAPALLGHLLMRRVGGVWLGGEIVETEAYLVGDPACHAYVRETARNRVMWGDYGRAYVFKIYGNYLCFNAVCRPPGRAEAVLIRAIEPTFNVEKMRELRSIAKDVDLTNGPSKLCLALGIEAGDNGADICARASDLMLAENPDRDAFLQTRAPIIQTTRIGLTKGVDWPLRWILGGSKSVSRRGEAATWPPGIEAPDSGDPGIEGGADVRTEATL